MPKPGLACGTAINISRVLANVNVSYKFKCHLKYYIKCEYNQFNERVLCTKVNLGESYARVSSLAHSCDMSMLQTGHEAGCD